MYKLYRFLAVAIIGYSSLISFSWADSVALVNEEASTVNQSAAYKYIDKPIRKSERDNRIYQALQLANGMKVLLISDSQATKSLAALAIPVGSLEDPNNQLGLAHYLEHMVLMGSKRYPDPDGFSQFLSKHGGSHNASTASYRTAYYLEVEHDAFVDAVKRLSNAIAEPLLDPRYADRERNAVNAELTMARTRDGMRMFQVDSETLNPLHPTSRFSGGNLETLSDKPNSKLHDELWHFYNHYYSSNLMVGVLYSTQSIDELTKLAIETFGTIKNNDAKVDEITVPAATEKEKGIIIHYVPAQPRKQLRIDFRIDNNIDEFRSKTDTYIGYLIGNRGENTLADWLQKQGLIENIAAGADPVIDRNGGIFIISVTLTDKGLANRDLVIAAIFNYLELIKSKGINKDYFDEISHVLALDFRYLSISRDMGYVEGLADTLLRLPIEHVLDGNYIADRYNPEAIQARLNEMTPQAARIWFISSGEPHDKQAYFVDAPYSIEKISPQRLALWQQEGSEISLTLPKLNPYIPDNFDIVTGKSADKKPEWVLKQKNVRAMFMPSQYFGDEPKANIIVALRNPDIQNDARLQVLAKLTDYLAGLKLSQLQYQAAVGGISFSSFYSNGLVFKADGFTQQMPKLLNKVLTEYQQFAATEQELIQAKSWYIQQLDAEEKVSAYELALQPIKSIGYVNYSESSERRKVLDSITLDEVNQYRDGMLKHSAPELLAVGNFTVNQVEEMAIAVQKQLATDATKWWHGQDMVIGKPIKANFSKLGSSTDSALAAVYIPLNYEYIKGKAYSSLLAQIIHPWFFTQLRTEEQLGYALFAFPISVGEQWGIGFLLQSNSTAPVQLYQRYLAFYEQADKRLSEMTDSDFNQYKQGLINELRQQPQTLSEEIARYTTDFGKSHYQFDSREKLIEQIGKITQQELHQFYRESLFDQTGLAVISQIMGKQDDNVQLDYAQPSGWQNYDKVSELQKQLKKQVRP